MSSDHDFSSILNYRDYRLRMDVIGPGGTRQSQTLRAGDAKRICGPQEFDTRGLDATLDAAGAQIAIVQLTSLAENTVSKLPETLQRFFFGRKRPAASSTRERSRNAAFFVYNETQPCVLQYMCLSRKLKGLGMGRLIYTAYERYVESLASARCKRIYLAALNELPVVNFYLANGFVNVDPPVNGPSDVEILDEDGVEVHIRIYSDTLFMVKRLDPSVPVFPPELVADVSDDSDESEDVLVMSASSSMRIETPDADARPLYSIDE